MAVYVGRWDCTTCGYKGVLGPKTECPNCGASRPKNVKFYLADEKDIVQDPEVLKKAKAGADWVCSYCGGDNKALETHCKTCGNDRDATDGDENLKVREYDTDEVPTTGDGTRDKKPKKTYPQFQPKKTKPLDKKKRWRIGIGIGVVVLLLIAFFGYSSEVTVTAAAFEWERTINVEENRKVIEEDWSVPTGGKQISSFEAIHHYDKILDHYETKTRTVREAVGTEEYVCGKRDLGNGYFEDKYCTRTIYESRQEEYEDPVYRKEPVYRTKYRYSIYRWKTASPIKTSGRDKNPTWGNTASIKSSSRLRESGRNATYTLIVTDEEGKQHKSELDFDRWKQIQKGQALKARKGLLGDYRGLAD